MGQCFQKDPVDRPANTEEIAAALQQIYEQEIANPTVLARIDREELDDLLKGYGYKIYYVEGDDPEKMHQKMAGTLDIVIKEIQAIQKDARKNGFKKYEADKYYR